MEDRSIISKALITKIHKKKNTVTGWDKYNVTFTDKSDGEIYKKQDITVDTIRVNSGFKLVEGKKYCLSAFAHGGWLPMKGLVTKKDLKEIIEEKENILEIIKNQIAMAEKETGKLKDVSFKKTKDKWHHFTGTLDGEDVKFVVNKKVDKDLVKNGLKVTLIKTKFGHILNENSIPGAVKKKIKKLKVKSFKLDKNKGDFDIYKVKTDKGTYLHAKKEGNEPKFSKGDEIEVEVFDRDGKDMFRDIYKPQGGNVKPKDALEMVIKAAGEDKKFKKKVLKALKNL